MRSLAAVLLLVGCGVPVAGSLEGTANGVTISRPRSVAAQQSPFVDRTAYEVPPLPVVSGGTLLVTRAGHVVAVDPDYDKVWVVLASGAAIVTLQLPVGVEVGRMAEDGAGLVHLVLRATGEVATLLISGMQVTLVSRRAVCAEPRGIAWNPGADELLVACSNGELVTLPPAGGDVTAVRMLGGDLRDVFVQPSGEIVVSRFRSSELLRISPTGELTVTSIPTEKFSTGSFDGGSRELQAGVAWRVGPARNGGVLVVHQRASTAAISLSSGLSGPDAGFVGGGSTAYGASSPFDRCKVPAALSASVTVVAADGTRTEKLISGPVPLDAVMDPNGVVMVAFGGAASVSVTTPVELTVPGACQTATPPPGFSNSIAMPGPAVAIALTPTGWVALTRSPPQLKLSPNALPGMTADRIALPVAAPRFDVGRDLFYRGTFSGLACASCHPDGREDGRVWNFNPGGARRTQTVAGGIGGTAPFHWDGTLRSMDELMNDVLVKRMGGGASPSERLALVRWMHTIPAPAPLASTTGSVARGEQLFRDAKTACITCHNGPHLTSNVTINVGTGEPLQVPSLIGIGARDPFMHDGCAKTLEDRFTLPCGGSLHGKIDHLTSQDVADLVAYLKRL